MAVDGSIRIKTKIDNSDLPRGIREAQEKIRALDKEIQRQQRLIDATNKVRQALNSQMAEYEQLISKAEKQGEAAKKNARTEEEIRTIEAQTASEIDSINQKYASLLTKVEKYDNIIGTANAHVQELRKQQEGIALGQTKLIPSASQFKAALKSAASIAQKLALTLGSKMLSGIKKAGSALGSMVSKFKQLVTQNSKLNRGLGSSAKSFARMALSMFGVQSIFAMISRAVNTYLSEDEELQQRMQDMWSTIGSFFAPAIEMVVGWLEKGVVYLNAFVKALTGVDTVAKRNAQALEKQAKAQESLSSAAFDEQNKLSDTSAETGNSTDTSTGGFASEQIEMPEWMEKAADTILKIKDALMAGDWKGAAKTFTSALNGIVKKVDWKKLGDKLGYGINGALTFLATSILTFDWYTLGSSLATSINSIIEGVDWANLGVVLGAGAIILIEGLGGAFATLDWVGLGMALADSFMGLWNAIDWKQAAKTLSDGVIGLLTTISIAIKNIEWQKIGNDVANYLASIDWGGITTALFDGIGAALGALSAFLWGLIKDAWGTCVAWWNENAYEDGKFTMQGLLNGIGDGIKGIGKWLYDHVWVPFRDGFKEAFGIHSPSTKMKEFGKYMIDGLVLGIGNIWDSVKYKFTSFADNIARFKLTIKEKAKEAGSAAVTGIKNGLSNLSDFCKKPINDLIEIVEKAVNFIIDKLNTLHWELPDWAGGASFGFNIPRISIPRLARGGIVNNPGRGVLATVGEAGKEAVLPLENNTEWMDLLAERLNGGEKNITIQVILSGRKIHEEIIRLSQLKNFATNGAK